MRRPAMRSVPYGRLRSILRAETNSTASPSTKSLAWMCPRPVAYTRASVIRPTPRTDPRRASNADPLSAQTTNESTLQCDRQTLRCRQTLLEHIALSCRSSPTLAMLRTIRSTRRRSRSTPSRLQRCTSRRLSTVCRALGRAPQAHTTELCSLRRAEWLSPAVARIRYCLPSRRRAETLSRTQPSDSLSTKKMRRSRMSQTRRTRVDASL